VVIIDYLIEVLVVMIEALFFINLETDYLKEGLHSQSQVEVEVAS